MQNQLFKLEDGLTISELESRHELSVILPSDEVEADTKTTEIRRCSGNKVDVPAVPAGGSGDQSFVPNP